MLTSHLPITQSALVSLLATLVGNAVALVPSWKPQAALVIQAGSFAIAIAFLIANALHARAGKPPAPVPVEFAARKVIAPAPALDAEGWPV